MDSRAEMEVVRSTKGNAAGEVSVHVVTTESTVQSTHLPTTAFIIPANATTINLPTSTLEIQRFPREPQRSTGAERPERGAGSEPITATVIPQISGVQTCSTVRVLEWKDGVATLPGSNLRVSVALGHCVCTHPPPPHPLELLAPCKWQSLNVPEQTKLPTAESMCHCDTCGRRHVSDGAREGRGFCSEHCHQQFKERSVIVENSASSNNATEILKPVKKRKRKDYQSPSEEEYESEQMEEKQEERKNSAGDSVISNPEADAWNGSQHGMEG
uniref:Uncharacterized protein n=1 Tax=Buteo japonicus TaxID=224669 RepID=A0A8C0BLM8_9AVES